MLIIRAKYRGFLNLTAPAIQKARANYRKKYIVNDELYES